MIGAVDVSVSFVDKLLKKNTGSIRFGSTASPINSTNTTPYKFGHIIDPYESCKYIKNIIDTSKSKKEEVKKEKLTKKEKTKKGNK